MQCRGGRRATALENANGDPSSGRLERKPQARRRRLVRRLGRAEKHRKGAAAFGSKRKAPELVVTDIAKPRDKSVAGAAFQHLLGCPKRPVSAGRPYYRERGEIDACCGKRRRISDMRRRE